MFSFLDDRLPAKLCTTWTAQFSSAVLSGRYQEEDLPVYDPVIELLILPHTNV